MKALFPILIAMLMPGANALAQDALFIKGQQAYDDVRYAEAIQCYETLLSNGVVNTEVHYNLANAYFKAGALPSAVWHYRTAWYSAPRDPDIRANLHFALNASGAVESNPTVVERALTTLSGREWIMVAGTGYVILCLLLLLALLIRTSRRPLLKLCLIPAAVLLIAAGGWGQWRQLRIHPEAVVVNAGITALFGPVEGATAHYKLPSGALVRQYAADPKGWIEVEYDGKRGWIKVGDILPLSP